jgi:uncharacterized protein (DUF779 family)
VSNALVGLIPTPSGAAKCQPDVRIATATQFELVNPLKHSNFIIAELVGGRLSFMVENLPKDRTGCPGRWMFDQMMAHFGTSVICVEGNWVGPVSDNLIELNRLTAHGVPIEEAAKQTWTGRRAIDWHFTQVRIEVANGTAGMYTLVVAVFDM